MQSENYWRRGTPQGYRRAEEWQVLSGSSKEELPEMVITGLDLASREGGDTEGGKRSCRQTSSMNTVMKVKAPLKKGE